MAAFYEVSIDGEALGQTITNVLYYLRSASNEPPFISTEPALVANAALTAWKNEVMPQLSQSYSVTGARVQYIDHARNLLSPFPTAVATTGTGSAVGTTDTVALCMIVGFQVGFLTDSLGIRPPRRSYVALGPLNNTHVDNDGKLVMVTSQRTLIENFFEASLTLSNASVLPAARVGTLNAEGAPSAGFLLNATIRPYVSFRRSRMRSTTGQA